MVEGDGVFFTLNNSIILGLLVFAIGAYGVLFKRNLLIILMSLEIMFNAVNIIILAFNYFNFYVQGQELGHYFVLLIIVFVAAEAAIGLAILVVVYRKQQHIDSDRLNQLKG